MVDPTKEALKLPLYDKKRSCYRIAYALRVENAIRVSASEGAVSNYFDKLLLFFHAYFYFS